MFKCVLFFALILLSVKLSFAQKKTQQIDLFKAKAALATVYASDSLRYFLVRFNKPEISNIKKYNPVKRLNYSYYIVHSRPGLLSGADISEVTEANALWKASGNLLQVWTKHANSNRQITVTVATNERALLKDVKKYGTVISRHAGSFIFKTSFKSLPALLADSDVLFVGVLRKAHPELAIPDLDLGVNDISAIADNYPGISGAGINVSIKEDNYDNDLDLLGRSFVSGQPSSNTTGHATTMATLIGGNGNSYIKGLGAAPQVKFTSSNFANLFPDSASIFDAFHISVQNHSYGTDIENFYSDESLAYDQQIQSVDTLVHVFSSGNVGNTASAMGLYDGITGYSNTTGTFKQAKNVLVVGGTDRANTSELLSSSGPAYDGRIIPELVADGEDGTSGAAALVSGTVALLQQAYKKQFGRLPSAALIKCVLINSADDIGAANVDYKTGYGKLNALEALRTISDGRFASGTVTNNQQNDINFNVPPGCINYKVSLAWNDPPASINAPAALINDLDLSVISPTGTTFLPWTLSSYPSADSLSKPAFRHRDSLNNTEQVSIQNPVAGNYTIHVKGRKVQPVGQVYYLAQQAVPANQFEWTYPAGRDQLFAADSNYLRWQNSYNVKSAALSVSYDHGTTWQAIGNITLKNNYYQWLPPDVFTTAMLKMDINGAAQISNEFVISKPLSLQVGYNCTSGTLLHWKAQPGATGYVIYNIKNNLLQKLVTVTDTTAIIPEGQQSSLYFAVSALGNGFEGLKSYTIDVTKQGVGCYVRALLASVVSNTIVLNLELGSVVNLKSIAWQKLTAPGQYTSLGTTPVAGSAISLQFTDRNPKNGIQFYRAQLTTDDNTVIYSDTASAIYLQPDKFAVFPNPVTTQVNILTSDINAYELKVYDAAGQLSIDYNLNELYNTIVINLVPGVYPYQIMLKGKVLFKGKLIKI